MYALTTSHLILSGVVLAVGCAMLATFGLPERVRESAESLPVSSINYDVLPADANLAELERGRVYFAQLCVPCHGLRGDGYGEWAYRVSPRPTDLTSQKVQRRSDEYLFDVISDGLSGTSMKAWKSQLSDRQRMQLVGYLRHLGRAVKPTST